SSHTRLMSSSVHRPLSTNSVPVSLQARTMSSSPHRVSPKSQTFSTQPSPTHTWPAGHDQVPSPVPLGLQPSYIPFSAQPVAAQGSQTTGPHTPSQHRSSPVQLSSLTW